MGRIGCDHLFSRQHERVAVWCYRFTGDRESAGDLAQDLFLRAYRNLDSFRGDSKFSTWLYTITRNHCVNEMKARAVRAHGEHIRVPGILDASKSSTSSNSSYSVRSADPGT